MTKKRRNALLSLSLLVIGLLSGLVVMQLALWYSDNLNQEISQCNAQANELQIIWFNTHRLDDLVRTYEQTSAPSKRSELLTDFQTWSDLLSISIVQLSPLPFYNEHQRSVLQTLKQQMHEYIAHLESVIELPNDSDAHAFDLLHTRAVTQLKAGLHDNTDRVLALLNSTIKRDTTSVTTIQISVRLLLLSLIAVSGTTVWTAFKSQQIAAEEMTRLNNQLEQHIDELQKTQDEALRASSTKSAFVANISHEVRTPLSGIIGTIELLLNEPLLPGQKIYAETIQQSADALLCIVNDMLDLSKIESGKLELRNTLCSPTEIVQDCTRLMSANAHARNLYCRYRIDEKLPPLVLVDPDRLRQILLNLIGNAIKFTQQGGILIDVLVVEQRQHSIKLLVNVTDTGIGISEENLGRLFKPFSQLDASTTGRPAGTGLGLLISKQLAKLMGGDIVAHSQVGNGSTFSVTIQCALPDFTSTPTILEPALQASQYIPTIAPDCKVLVVEDNPVLQMLTMKQLQSLGIQAQAASDGNTALAATESQAFNLILMDVHLPDVNGYDVTLAIRNREVGSNRHIPIIAMTAAAMANDREMCFRAGMDDYLPKPVKMDDMIRVVNRWLSLPKNAPGQVP